MEPLWAVALSQMPANLLPNYTELLGCANSAQCTVYNENFEGKIYNPEIKAPTETLVGVHAKGPALQQSYALTC